jgi:hypothetical protein
LVERTVEYQQCIFWDIVRKTLVRADVRLWAYELSAAEFENSSSDGMANLAEMHQKQLEVI